MERTFKSFEEKTNTMAMALQVKDVDLATRTVCGYFSAFGNKDLDGDIIVPGAYAKSLAERRDKVKHLEHHNARKFAIGKLLELKEDNIGLYFESRISEAENATLIKYQEGIIDEHSVGMRIIKGDWSQQDDAYLIKEAFLWEGSTVTFGANPETPVTAIKSMTQEQRLDVIGKYAERLDKLSKLLRTSSNLKDHDFELMAIEAAQLSAKINALKDIAEPVNRSKQNDEPLELESKDATEAIAAGIRDAFKEFNQ